MVLAHTWNAQGLLMALCSGIIPDYWDCSIHPGLSPGWLPARQTPYLLYTISSSNLVYFILSRDLCRIMLVLHAHTHTHSGMHISNNKDLFMQRQAKITVTNYTTNTFLHEMQMQLVMKNKFVNSKPRFNVVQLYIKAS